MDAARDLACAELWQTSLERSLARRGKPTRSSLELFHLMPARDLSIPDFLQASTRYSELRRSAVARRPSMVLPGAGGISALALLVATALPGLLGGRSRPGHESVALKAPKAETAAARVAPSAVAQSRSAAAPSVATRTSTVASAGSDAPPVHAVAAAATPAIAVAHSAGHASTSSRAHAVRSSPPPTQGHVAVADDPGAARDVAGGTARAVSGGVAPKTSATAPRVPANPQPSGHPSTGGGAVERSAESSVHHTAAGTVRIHTITKPVGTTKPVVAATKPAPKPKPAPAPAVAPGSYINPLAGATVTPERIDQGVDYAGSGPLGAIGAGKVTYVATAATGWPGAFIEYQLSDGSFAGRYVYYAEGVSPAAGLHVGQTLRPGQEVASIIPGSSSGIEIGWGAGIGSETLAEQLGQWSGGDDADSVPSPSGESFSALIAKLGGPPGKVEGS